MSQLFHFMCSIWDQHFHRFSSIFVAPIHFDLIFFNVLFRTFEQFTSEIIRWNRAKYSLANKKRIKISSRDLMREVDKNKNRVENFLSQHLNRAIINACVLVFLFSSSLLWSEQLRKRSPEYIVIQTCSTIWWSE